MREVYRGNIKQYVHFNIENEINDSIQNKYSSQEF